jgi:hypothetical protein
VFVCVHCREHSWRALFAGLRPAVGATAASQGIYFTCYSVLRQMAVVSVWALSFNTVLHTPLTSCIGRRCSLPAPAVNFVRCAPSLCAVLCWVQARKLAALKQRQAQLPDGGKSVGISVGASMLVASLAGCVNVLLTNPICECSRAVCDHHLCCSSSCAHSARRNAAECGLGGEQLTVAHTHLGVSCCGQPCQL